MVYRGMLTTHTGSHAITRSKNVESTSRRDTRKSSIFSKHRKRSPKEIEAEVLNDLCGARQPAPVRKKNYLNIAAERPNESTSGRGQRSRSQSALVPATPTFLTCSRELSRSPTPGLTGSCATIDYPSPPPTPILGDHQFATAQPRVLKTGDFVGLKVLGQGGHGKVFLVQDKVTNRQLAMKLIEKDGLHLSSYARIFEEQMIMKVMEGCERSVTVRGSFQDHENFYILTDYFPGRDLRRRVGRKPLLIHIVRRYMSELVLALEELHARHIIHRDIKPENILIDQSGRLLIADFGISRIFGRPPEDKPWESLRTWHNTKTERYAPMSGGPPQDITRTPCGTPGYMPPEVYEHYYSYPADIWSLGVVLHVMLLGRLPFGLVPGSQRTAEMKERTQRLAVKISEDERTHPDVEDLLMKMLEKGPTKRITLAQIKSHPFFKTIDWASVPKSTPDDLRSYRSLSNGPISPEILIPVGTAYEPGTIPFPWFEHVSPQMRDVLPAQVPVPMGAKYSASTQLPSGFYDDMGETEAHLPGAPASTKFTRRLKHWWKRKRTMEVKPVTLGERMDLLA